MGGISQSGIHLCEPNVRGYQASSDAFANRRIQRHGVSSGEHNYIYFNILSTISRLYDLCDLPLLSESCEGVKQKNVSDLTK